MENSESVCGCTNVICHHANGEPCGKPVENPLPGRWTDGHGLEVSEEFRIGICNGCWERVRDLRE